MAINALNTNATKSSNKPSSTIGHTTTFKALHYLLNEDPLLEQFNLTSNDLPQQTTQSSSSTSKSDPPAFAYAAALMQSNGNKDLQQKAQEALSEVDRKLALVESLSERISREKPEYVAAQLLKLHGYDVFNKANGDKNSGENQGDSEIGKNNNTTITSTLERCDRLKRQAQVLDSVANRVESTLVRGLDRMSLATSKLERVLKTSQVLKMIMKLRFEAKKVLGSNSNFDTLAYVDLRDLTRTAASVSIMEELLNHEDLKGKGIDIVEQMRPEAERVAKVVRKVAAELLTEQHKRSSSNAVVSATKLGATLQVYYHLGELPDAAWNAVCLGLEKAQTANEEFFNASSIKKIMEEAKTTAKKIADEEISANGITDKKQKELIQERTLQKQLRVKKSDAAATWANGISEAALQVWNLHRVLSRKSDPITREKFIDVVNAAPVPEMFHQAQQLLGQGKKQDEQKKKFSIFSLFWNQMCISIGMQIEVLLKQDNGAVSSDLATFFPMVRSAALEMLNFIQETMQAGSLSSSSNQLEDSSAISNNCGIMGGSAVLDEAIFFGWGNEKLASAELGGMQNDTDDIGGTGVGAVSADTWTRPDITSDSKSLIHDNNVGGLATKVSKSISQTSSALSSILTSPEWYVLQGYGNIGLHPIQRAFVKTLQERLNAPLNRMFVENRVVDENGIDMKMLPTLPSSKDLKDLELCLRKELSLADPREGGGEFNMTTMISECIADLVENFCSLARGATSGISEDKMLSESNGAVTEELLHDIKLAAVMASLTSSLRNLPENTFVKPYRPAHTLQHEEAASMCQIALLPAIHEIESFVKNFLLKPLSRVLNKKIAKEMALMHRGVYVDSISGDINEGSFVQEHLAGVYENVVTNVLSRLPEEYGGMVSSTLATFSIYCFVSNASLVRPLGEMGRLKITQDLGDLELTLEQLMFKGGSSIGLNQVSDGNPYSELRAVRQMLFWNGLENKDLSSEQVAKAFFREVWVKDVRPSTAFHFLLTFAPKLLSSPHHANRVTAEEYVKTLVNMDGSVDDGEAASWMTTMKCCDSYQQRESIDVSGIEGDRRISAILMIIGPELLRRRRQ